MQFQNSFAFLCTGQAPVGGELIKIRLSSILFLAIGIVIYVLLLRLIRKKVHKKQLLILSYILLNLAAIAALGLGLFLYAISTCGI